MQIQSHHHNANNKRGQALVEFALILPVLLILTMLIIQYGIISFTTSGLTNLSREGARFAATAPASDADIRQRIRNVLPPNINYNDLTITISPAPSNDARRLGSKELIDVTISYPMSKKLFLPSSFFGFPIFSKTYTTTTQMMVE